MPNAPYVIDVEVTDDMCYGTCKQMPNLLMAEKTLGLIKQKAPSLIKFLLDYKKNKLPTVEVAVCSGGI